ncbi:MAG: hypothetical protein N3B11_02245 [Coriobacteriia bacterium]|nr:hypothetical protein [Coriobacteriia bacterium]
MKRLTIVSLAVVLIAALAVPGVAVAKKGGMPASMRSRGHGARASSDVGAAGTEAPEKGHGKRKGAAFGTEQEGARKGLGAGKASPAPGASEDGTSAAGPGGTKRTGIANALDRLQRNLARMQAQMEAGQRKGLPPGLQRVIAKFLGWLGLSEQPQEQPGAGDEAPSEEPTGTVEPTGTAEPPGPEPMEPVPIGQAGR